MLPYILWVFDVKYAEELLDYASKLDAVTTSQGKITSLALEITEKQTDEAISKLLQESAHVLQGDKSTKEIKVLATAFHHSLLKYLGHEKISQVCKLEKEVKDTRSLEDLLEEIQGLVGLGTVKEQVRNLVAYQKVQTLRKAQNLNSLQNTLHLAFMGNPGTGKTTVARIVGHIYKQLNLLSKGHFIEVSRTDLIAGYQGQTALKVKAVIERAKGGVLFIDEAYSITENQQNDSYGRECLTELTKALEDYRDDLVVIVAGYTKPMEQFFQSNPGLLSRFNTFIQFDDYNGAELLKILETICKQNDYVLADDLKSKLFEYFTIEITEKDDSFSNGRFVRNLYDDLVMRHALRLVTESAPSKEELSLLIGEDFCPFTD